MQSVVRVLQRLIMYFLKATASQTAVAPILHVYPHKKITEEGTSALQQLQECALTLHVRQPWTKHS